MNRSLSLFGLVALGFAAVLLAGDKSAPEPPAPGGGGDGGKSPPKPGGGSTDPHAPPWNPPPPGPVLKNSELTPSMIAWASEVLALSPPIHSEVYRVFPEGEVIARVDWHTKQWATGKEGIFKAVTLYWAERYLT